MSAVTEPGVSRKGRTLLYRVRIHQQRHGRSYLLQCENDQCGARNAARGGYLRRTPGAINLVTLTPKGEDYLDRLMRCE
ncbi:hypothetical protein PH562_18805 [Rhizobium sp. CNPSo 4062]|uniref:hypothetical protein n=1 Tax=Rhizobium sp. CNPSo 4062 TaxID=3021410 RepID=UPI00254EE359|nr:hypothetical protein [Rhizobium sp. CNPSo 4062]MDK4704310.1 hypothetical protein [Rhizobium sp. CNPSo 4062]